MSARNVVVIGASAGGLEGLMRIVRDLTPGLPSAFFVAMHVSPSAHSRLPEILGRIARYPTSAVTPAGDQIAEGRIYVATPDRHIVIEDGRVFASAGPRENHHRPSIDALFRSAALAYGSRTVGVILSGTLDDGTAGLRWIKRADGIALVQDPAEALFRGMPASAIANVNVDRVLRAEEIAAGIADAVTRGGGEVVSDNGSVDDQGAPRSEEGAHPASDFVCPDCGGTLFRMGDDEVMRFRCRVGHAYSPEGLHAEQSRNLEESLWTAVRSLEEHADLSRRLAAWARRASLPIAEVNFTSRADDALRKAAVVRRALDERSDVPQEPQPETA
ncbi:MAG TPA: chemotaxis protein CheB [Candidatus Limnocylindrales bacterium]|nr:chemotaxis protein CheB [Candidatus Limnocylindrales bacterium]